MILEIYCRLVLKVVVVEYFETAVWHEALWYAHALGGLIILND